MEQPPSPFKVPASPGTPLQQLSPDRINQQRIPASPSLPNQLSNAGLKIPSQSTDVQSKVAFLNSLTQAGSPSRQQGVSTHAALQRALLGREEAENALRTSTTQLAEAELQQRKISEKLESLAEELQSVKERQTHERQVFEKEVRKARKDAFRAGSALVKAQEDLKESRAEAKNLRVESQRERLEKEKSQQEAFERAYTLAGVLEETEVLRKKLQAMEAARDAEMLEQRSYRLQREDEDRLFAGKRQMEVEEHVVRLPEDRNVQEIHGTKPVQPRQNRFERIRPVELPPSEPRVRRAKGWQTSQPKQLDQESHKDATNDIQEQILVVDAELQWEKKLRIRAEEMVHFLQMECQFNICACRVAEKNGRRFVHDKEYNQLGPVESLGGSEEALGAELQGNECCESKGPLHEMLVTEKKLLCISQQKSHEDALPSSDEPDSSPTKVRTLPAKEIPSPSGSGLSSTSTSIKSSQAGRFSSSSVKNASSPAIFSAEDMTYQSPLRTMIRPRSVCSISSRGPEILPSARSPSASPFSSTPGFTTPQRQGLRLVHSETTTTMVPLRDNDDVFCPAPGTPGTPVSREAALAQIRARRDRARSVATSTSRSALGSARRGLAGGLRDISAPGRF